MHKSPRHEMGESNDQMTEMVAGHFEGFPF